MKLVSSFNFSSSHYWKFFQLLQQIAQCWKLLKPVIYNDQGIFRVELLKFDKD